MWTTLNAKSVSRCGPGHGRATAIDHVTASPSVGDRNPKVLYTEILKSRSMTDSELITATEPN